MTNHIKTELQTLYADASKHSTYQSIPDFVSAELGYSETIDEQWRGDKSRLIYLLAARQPADGEHWGDFGANTGFFTLSLAKLYPRARFTAIEANPNHALFIQRIAEYFNLTNVSVIDRAIGMRELLEIPCFDFLLHLNVLHHAGHDFDRDLLELREDFPAYATRYLDLLRSRARGLLFQLGSNWGGDKTQPIINVGEDTAKLRLFGSWLHRAGWSVTSAAYPSRNEDGSLSYRNLVPEGTPTTIQVNELPEDLLDQAISKFELDQFRGEFNRRPLFFCSNPAR
jgi:hypothetical protein